MALQYDTSASPLWSVRKEGLSRSCAVRFVPIGVEVRILRADGRLLYSRAFADGEGATSWANEERDELLREAWTELPVAIPTT